MAAEYKVKSFIPKVSGCGSQDTGWDNGRCLQYEEFLNRHSQDGWKLHSSEFRQATVAGCGGGQGAVLVCVFERGS